MPFPNKKRFVPFSSLFSFSSLFFVSPLWASSFLQQTRVYPYPLGAGSARPNPKMGAPDPENPLFLGFSVLRGGLRPWSRTMVSEGARPWGRGRSGDCDFLQAQQATAFCRQKRNFTPTLSAPTPSLRLPDVGPLKRLPRRRRKRNSQKGDPILQNRLTPSTADATLLCGRIGILIYPPPFPQPCPSFPCFV